MDITLSLIILKNGVPVYMYEVKDKSPVYGDVMKSETLYRGRGIQSMP